MWAVAIDSVRGKWEIKMKKMIYVDGKTGKVKMSLNEQKDFICYNRRGQILIELL